MQTHISKHMKLCFKTEMKIFSPFIKFPSNFAINLIINLGWSVVFRKSESTCTVQWFDREHDLQLHYLFGCSDKLFGTLFVCFYNSQFFIFVNLNCNFSLSTAASGTHAMLYIQSHPITSSGAQVVPIPMNLSADERKEILNSVNGVVIFSQV